MVNILNITRHTIKDERLAPWVKFLWQIDAINADLHYKLLPTDCIDIILNLADDMVYETEFDRIVAPSFHINGLRSNHSFIHQENTIRIFGVSFYPFVHKPLNELHNRVVDLSELSFDFAQCLKKAVANDSNKSIVAAIESALVEELSINQDFTEKAQLISDFMATNSGSVKSFCREQALNIKTFERMFLHYTGYTPKSLSRIKRFQNASNQFNRHYL